MNYTCSQCDFTAKFKSSLTMHHQLHHENENNIDDYPVLSMSDSVHSPRATALTSSDAAVHQKCNSLPRDLSPASSFRSNRGMRLVMGRTSSATKILGRLRARICKSKTLFSHPEEPMMDVSANSECTSKAMKECLSRASAITTCLHEHGKEIYACHLCDFDADRITVLDRHLLTDHKLSLDHLLKLVLAKTKDGLSEDASNLETFSIRTPYYKPVEEIIDQGDYFIETVGPKIKILKHVGVNTDLQWSDIPDLKDNCRKITKELDKLMKFPIEKFEKQEFLEKMNILNDCMCKFVDSSNTLKKVLSKEYEGKHRKDNQSDDSLFNLRLDEQETPREFEKAHSEKLERHRSKSKGEKSKLSAESYYF